MPDIYGTNADGFVRKYGFGATWASQRDATSGTADSNDPYTSYAVRGVIVSIFGGAILIPDFSRSFMSFDTSGISVTPDSASLKLYGHTALGAGTDRDFFILKSTHNTSTLQNADFVSITGWSTGSSDGSGAGDNESAVTKYSAMWDISSSGWSTSGYNTVPLNATGLAAMASLDTFKICIIDVSDLRDLTETVSGQKGTGFKWTESLGDSYDPYLTYVEGEEEAAVVYNAPFFGANF